MVNQSSLSTDGARGALLEDATFLRVEVVVASFSAASAASIHSEYMSIGSVRSKESYLVASKNSMERQRTVSFTLISLVAYFAKQLRYALLPVNSDGDRLVVVAEQTSEADVWEHG